MDSIPVSQKISHDFGKLRRLSDDILQTVLRKFLDVISVSNMSNNNIDLAEYSLENELEESLDAISTVLIESAKMKIGIEALK